MSLLANRFFVNSLALTKLNGVIILNCYLLKYLPFGSFLRLLFGVLDGREWVSGGGFNGTSPGAAIKINNCKCFYKLLYDHLLIRNYCTL